MKGTVFYKMTGSGNDFVMLDGRYTTEADWPAERIVAVCDRRDGVGADGLVILTPEDAGSVRMAFFNCDGSRAAMCGNAALCSTRLSAALELAPPAGMRLITDAGTFPTRCTGPGALAELNLPDVATPTPIGPDCIPRLAGEDLVTLSTVGVPHLVVLVPDVEGTDVLGRGRDLRHHPGAGPAGANVNFVSPPKSPDDPWTIRTYERGVEGETLACGTGAVAAGISLAGARVGALPARFRTRSGRFLSVSGQLEDGLACHVWLGGEGRLVCRGVLES